jgi:hypothetical protein
MVMHTIPAIVHKTRAKLKTNAETTEPISKKTTTYIITYIDNNLFLCNLLTFERFDKTTEYKKTQQVLRIKIQVSKISCIST